MTTAFPTALDNFSNPVGSDTQLAVPHADQHANVNDASEAIQAKVGADGSAVTTTHDYKLSGITGSEKAVSTASFSGTSIGTNTGDQALVFTGVVTGSGTSTILLSIKSGAVAHVDLSGIGTNTHAAIDTHIAATGSSVHGLGTMSTQNAGAVAVTGGTLVSVTISGSTLVSSTVSGATVLASTLSGATLVDSILRRRPVTLSNSSGITINLASGNIFTLTGLTTATVFSITGTASAPVAYPYEMRVFTTASQTVSFDSTARASSDQSLPTTTFGSSKWERWLFEWNEYDSKLDILTVNRGH